MKPSEETKDRAAERLARLAEGGLEGWHVLMRGDELEHFEPFKPTWRIDFSQLGDVEVSVPPPSAFDLREELVDACRVEIENGIYNRGDSMAAMMPEWFELTKEKGDDPATLRRMVGWFWCDERERKWRERIDAEWPRLSAVEAK